jgi:hypothetical protein
MLTYDLDQAHNSVILLLTLIALFGDPRELANRRSLQPDGLARVALGAWMAE